MQKIAKRRYFGIQCKWQLFLRTYFYKIEKKMSAKERKILNISIVPQKLNQFRESLQGAFETCDAKAYAEYIADDVRLCPCFQFFQIIFSFRLKEQQLV
jgi:hypothetical protein